MGNLTNRPAPPSIGALSGAGEQCSRGVLVAIGASAGGVQALSTVMSGLPADFAAAVFVVLHVLPGGHSMLAPILSRAGALDAFVAQEGERVLPGRIYVAPPRVHTTVLDGCVRLSSDPPEKGARPSINVLFRSVAACYGQHAVGVVLSGTLDDGADGLRSIKQRGGTAIVQDPDDAQFDGMPRQALAVTAVDRVVPAGGIAQVLVELLAGDAQVGASPA
jgi:two-component system, chemotaxis family, protein-glutamate methylesterase/glutaminase